MPNEVTKQIEAILKRQDGTYQIWASTKDEDRDGEIILPSAFKNLEAYLKTNPVILFGHQHYQPPVGKAVAGRIKDKGLVLDIVFAETEFGKEIKYLYDEGFMNSFSVGFIPKAWDVDGENRRVFTDVELLEVSAVPVPANAAATMMRSAKSKGIDLPEVQKLYPEQPEATRMPKSGETGDKTVTRGDRIRAFAKVAK